MLWFAAAAFCSFHHGEVESLPNVYFPVPSPLLPAIALATASLLRLKTTHLTTSNIQRTILLPASRENDGDEFGTDDSELIGR
jgi:hypothetical protein